MLFSRGHEIKNITKMFLFIFLVSFFKAFLAWKLIYKINIYLTLCLAHFLNKIIYQTYLFQKFDLKVYVFQNRNWESFHRKDFKWKKIYGGTVLVFKKTEALYAEFNERMEAATSSYSTTSKFLQYIYSVFVAKNHQKIRSMCLVHEFFFTDIFNDINHGHRAALLKKNYLWLLPF